MENIAVDIFSTYGMYGVFGILFCLLLVYVLKNTEAREKQLQAVLTTFANTLPVMLESLRKLEESQSNHCEFVTAKLTKIEAKL